MDYPYIQAWHYMTGSMPYYVDDLVSRAKREKAPADAIFRRDDRTWARASECPNRDAIARCNAWLEGRGIAPTVAA